MSVPITRRKIHWNKSLTAKICLVWSLLLGKNYTEKGVTAKVSLENFSEMFGKKASFEAGHLSQLFDDKGWY